MAWFKNTSARRPAGDTSKLNNFLPYDESQIESISKDINKIRCQLIICDISPMGIVVAQKARVPSVLIENFTWDWVYENYVSADFPADQHVDYLKRYLSQLIIIFKQSLFVTIGMSILLHRLSVER